MSPVLNPTAGSRPHAGPRIARLKRALAGLLAGLSVVAEAIAEARAMQRAAYKRYPSVGE
jgi:hypothetical protein